MTWHSILYLIVSLQLYVNQGNDVFPNEVIYNAILFAGISGMRILIVEGRKISGVKGSTVHEVKNYFKAENGS